KDLDDLTVVETGRTQGVHIGDSHVRSVLDDLECEGQRSCRPRVGRAPGLRFSHLGGACTGLLAEQGMRGETVVAAIAIGNGNCNLLAEFSPDPAGAQRSERAPHAVESGGRVRHRPEHVRDDTKGAFDLVEGWLYRGVCGSWINEVLSCHNACLLLCLEGIMGRSGDGSRRAASTSIKEC